MIPDTSAKARANLYKVYIYYESIYIVHQRLLLVTSTTWADLARGGGCPLRKLKYLFAQYNFVAVFNIVFFIVVANNCGWWHVYPSDGDVPAGADTRGGWGQLCYPGPKTRGGDFLPEESWDATERRKLLQDCRGMFATQHAKLLLSNCDKWSCPGLFFVLLRNPRFISYVILISISIRTRMCAKWA